MPELHLLPGTQGIDGGLRGEAQGFRHLREDGVGVHPYRCPCSRHPGCKLAEVGRGDSTMPRREAMLVEVLQSSDSRRPGLCPPAFLSWLLSPHAAQDLAVHLKGGASVNALFSKGCQRANGAPMKGEAEAARQSNGGGELIEEGPAQGVWRSMEGV